MNSGSSALISSGAQVAAAPNPRTAALIQTGLERFARLGERPEGAISISIYQAQGMKPTDQPAG